MTFSGRDHDHAGRNPCAAGMDGNIKRRAHLCLDKIEPHHDLKSALRIGRQGEIRDRPTDAQRLRIAGLHLLAAIIICLSYDQFGHAFQKRGRAGLATTEDQLRYVSTLEGPAFFSRSKAGGPECWHQGVRICPWKRPVADILADICDHDGPNVIQLISIGYVRGMFNLEGVVVKQTI